MATSPPLNPPLTIIRTFASHFSSSVRRAEPHRNWGEKARARKKISEAYFSGPSALLGLFWNDEAAVVLAQVLLQLVGSREVFAAFVARERPLAGVSSMMSLQMGQSKER